MKKVYVIMRKITHPETKDLVYVKLEEQVFTNEMRAEAMVQACALDIKQKTVVRPLIYDVSFEIRELELVE